MVPLELKEPTEHQDRLGQLDRREQLARQGQSEPRDRRARLAPSELPDKSVRKEWQGRRE